jgi:vesicle coat complex subunit
LERKEELMLLYNSINKNINDNDPLNRWLIVHLITSLRNQTVNHDCAKQLVSLCVDSNPIIKRLSLISLIEYIKTNENTSIVSPSEMQMVIKKYFSDPHPLVFSTAFHAIVELKNKDYIELNIPNKLKYFLDNLHKVDDFYFERVVFTLINFSKLFLFNNFDKNIKYIIEVFKKLYQICKYTTNTSKALACLVAIYEIIQEIKNLKLNTISLDELNLFKNKKQLLKVSNLLIKNYLFSKTAVEKYLSLDIILKYLNSTSEFFDTINLSINNNLNLFFLNGNDKAYINTKKLEILILMTNEKNIKIILEEFRKYNSYNNINVSVVSSIYYICQRNKENSMISSFCIERLIDMLKLKDDNIISHVIICLRKLILEIKEHTRYVLVYSIKNYKKIISNVAKSNIIWMISQNIDIMPTVSVDFLRRLLLEIDNESDEIKSQLLGLAVRIFYKLEFITKQFKEDSSSMTEKINVLINYAVEKILYDKNYNLREKARLVNLIIKNNLLSNLIEYKNNINDGEKTLNNESSQTDGYYLLGLFNKLEGDTTNKKFIFDYLDKSIDPNIFKISLDEILNIKKEDTVKQYEDLGKNNQLRYAGVKQENNTAGTVANFDSNVNIEEIRNKLKNELDDLLNNDEDEEEWEVEIKKD